MMVRENTLWFERWFSFTDEHYGELEVQSRTEHTCAG